MEPTDQQSLVNSAIYSGYKMFIRDVTVKELKRRAQQEGIVSLLEKRFPDMLPSDRQFFSDIDQLAQTRKWGKLSAKDTVALFVTFSPEPGTITGSQIQLLIFPWLTKNHKGISSWIYCVEQSGTLQEQNEGYHPHAHILLQLNKSHQCGEREKVRDRIVSKFSSFRTKSDNFLQIKAVSQNKLEDKIGYIKGIKYEEKTSQLEADRVWRKKLNLLDYYESRSSLAEIHNPPTLKLPIVGGVGGVGGGVSKK